LPVSALHPEPITSGTDWAKPGLNRLYQGQQPSNPRTNGTDHGQIPFQTRSNPL